MCPFIFVSFRSYLHFVRHAPGFSRLSCCCCSFVPLHLGTRDHILLLLLRCHLGDKKIILGATFLLEKGAVCRSACNKKISHHSLSRVSQSSTSIPLARWASSSFLGGAPRSPDREVLAFSRPISIKCNDRVFESRPFRIKYAFGANGKSWSIGSSLCFDDLYHVKAGALLPLVASLLEPHSPQEG